MLPEPPDGYYEQKHAQPQLEAYLRADKDHPVTPLPRRADPALADEIVTKALDDDEATMLEVRACGELMRFYALDQRAEQLPNLLNKQERNDERFMRSLSAVGLLADFGDDAMRKQAAEYCGYLATHYLAPKYYPAMVNMLFRLPEDTDEQMIVTPIKNHMVTLKSKAASDPKAKGAHRKLEILLEEQLPTVKQGRTRCQQILKAPDVKHHRRDMIRCYLRFDRNAYVDLRSWAIMMIQRECKTGDHADFAEAFLNAFELLMTSASRKGVLPEGDEEDLKKYVTSCARAVDFYHGKLEPPQQEYADKYNNEEQYDLLHWDLDESKEAMGYAPPKREPPPGAETGEKTDESAQQKPEGK